MACNRLMVTSSSDDNWPSGSSSLVTDKPKKNKPKVNHEPHRRQLIKSVSLMILGAETESLPVAHFFTCDRFWPLVSNIHHVDNEKYVDRNHQDYDKPSFQNNYSLGQNVSMDEAMVKGKGHNPVKQYMPMKPIKQGEKLWCIGCSCCAYLRDFQLSASKERVLQSKV